MCYNKAAATAWTVPLHDTERTDLPMPLHSTTVCSIPECKNLAGARGWCHKHYQQGWTAGGKAITRKGHSLDRLLSCITILPSGCWEWNGAKDRYGYGHLRLPVSEGGRYCGAYRAVYERFIGRVPEGMELDHLCRNPSCVNPTHLEPVTHHVNTLRARKTHCPHGHEYTPENTYVVHRGVRGGRKGTERSCKACVQLRRKA